MPWVKELEKEQTKTLCLAADDSIKKPKGPT